MVVDANRGCIDGLEENRLTLLKDCRALQIARRFGNACGLATEALDDD